MDIFHDPEAGFENPRMHPYISKRAGEAGFIDFKREPERIAHVLEDFVKFSHKPAIQTFYGLLAWLNGPESILESCDCALRGPEVHGRDHASRPLCAHGRLMLMYRNPLANCDERIDLLYDTLGDELNAIDPQLKRDQAAVSFALSPVLYKGLSLGCEDEDGFILAAPNDPGRGHHVLLQFQAFGNDTEEAFRHLDRVFQNLELACRRTSEMVKGTSDLQG